MKPLLLLVTMVAVLPAAGLKLRSAGGSNISLRKRLHINTLITEPGTFEVDWSTLYSTSTGDYSMPSAIKYTPEGTTIPWGRTEYSIAFDTVTTAGTGGSQVRFSQTATVTGTAVLKDGDKLDIAIAPQASFFLRDEQGARLGATAIARYDSGVNSTGVTLGWSGATHSSGSNPAGTLDAGFGYGRNLASSGLAEKFTPHCNVIWEKATGVKSTVAVFEGVEYQMTERVAFDLSGQQYPGDRQIVFGMTVNLGHTH